MRTGSKYAEDGYAWTQGIAYTLQHVLLARASNRESIDIHSGFSRLLRTHERLALGGQRNLVLPTIKLDTTSLMNSWTDLAVNTLGFLLSSRSAEVIETAIVGIQALATYNPCVIKKFIELTYNDKWRFYWILNSAEVWACLFPRELEESRKILEAGLKNLPLHLRLQTWLVLCKLNKASGCNSVPDFPYPQNEYIEKCVVGVVNDPLEEPEKRDGSLSHITPQKAALSIVKRLEHVLPSKLNELKNDIILQFRNWLPEDYDSLPWPARIIDDKDTRINGHESDAVLDSALDKYLKRYKISK